MTQLEPTGTTTPPEATAADLSVAADVEATLSDANRPVQTVRSGSIGASIWQNSSRDGTDKIGITFSRSWKSQDGDTGYSQTFYAGNREDIHKAVDQACDVAQALERAVSRRMEQLTSELRQPPQENAR